MNKLRESAVDIAPLLRSELSINGLAVNDSGADKIKIENVFMSASDLDGLDGSVLNLKDNGAFSENHRVPTMDAEGGKRVVSERYVPGVEKSGFDDIKMEFVCESVKLLESDFNPDFFIEQKDECDIGLPEIGSTLDHGADDTSQSFGMLLLVDHNNGPKEEDESRKLEDDLELSTVLSDHNYTSQEKITQDRDLRRLLINHILSNGNVSKHEAKQVSNFVSLTIDKINEFKNRDEEPKSVSVSQKLDSSRILEDNEEGDDGESFARSVMSAVLAEDAAEEEGFSFALALKPAARTDQDRTKNASDEKPHTPDTKSAELSDIDHEEPNNSNNGQPIQQQSKNADTEANNPSPSQEIDSLPYPAVPSPADNCSEPLEHTTFDEAFDVICNNKSTEIAITNQLERLKIFSKTIYDDCESFASSTTEIRDKFRNYVKNTYEKFKDLFLYVAKDFHVEIATQTEKQNLPDSSGNEAKWEARDSFQKREPKNTRNGDGGSRVSVKIDENIATEYDDGIPLAKYTQSEIFESEILSDGESVVSKARSVNKTTSTDSEDSGTELWLKKRPNTKGSSVKSKMSQSESDKENSNLKTPKSSNKSKSSVLNDGDKEIERLINLDVLDKRTTHSGSVKNGEKSKAKTKFHKDKENLLNVSDEEFQKDLSTDESFNESEEEIITEKQYLVRCNENLKNELLNDSSSECSEIDEDSDELLSDDEDGSKSPLVDKFLKKFNVAESDEDENEVETQSNAAFRKINIDRKSQNSNENSPKHSDCELLDGTFESRKQQSRPKSLEKLLLEQDKRKNINKICDDLISLSSASDSSDVEAVEEAKSRIIKPMLRQDQLASETRKAQKEENDRIKRLERKHTMLAKLCKQRHEINKKDDLILDYNEETKEFIKVHPEIVKHLKPHQIDGVKFMYDSCYCGVDGLKKHPGSGCILAHCMGLGKTLQLIALLHTVVSYKELKTRKVLVLCPKSTVMNWADEIKRWLGPLKTRNIKHYTFNDASDINDKLRVLREWSAAASTIAGTLIIGYEAFRTLVCYHSYKNRGINSARLESIREDVDKYLLNPGADLVICDEGHIIKNSKSAISLAVSQIKTPKRIILTGTPIQNNLKEYYSMVNFIKPLFLGTEKEFANLYANPIKNGQHKDSSKRDIKVMKQRSFVLHKKLSKFVQRKEAELLKSFLPQKYEYVLFIPMTDVQNNLYEFILETISKGGENRGKSLITDYTCLRKIWTHPKVLEDAWKNATQKPKKDLRKNMTAHSDDEQPDDVFDSHTGAMSVTNDWWRSLLSEEDLETIRPSNKLRTMFEILRMCEEKGEKCLIFSAFVAVLNVVEYFFKKITNGDTETLRQLSISPNNLFKNTWICGKDYYRLDGKTPKLIRHEMVEQFNSVQNKRARVFLISARAGGQGINLTGANRVIILDTSWNPSNDQQNIFRIFRLGQKRNCYIYRLIAMGTMEEKVYSRSVTKQAMSFRVVDEQQIDRHYSMAELAELYTLTVPNYATRSMPECPQDTILASLLLNHPHLVYKYHEHDSLLENKVEQELSEQEKADAWAAYERELQLSSEIREVPNLEDFQSNFAASKMPHFLSNPLSGFDVSSFPNYANQFPFMQSLLSPYNYPSPSPYLELYKRVAQANFGFPDTPTFNTSAYVQNPTKSMSNTSSLLSGLHGSGMHSNPLSALGDLSIYGINAPSNHNPLNPPTQHSVATQRQQPHSVSMYDSSLSTSTTNANLLLSSFCQYNKNAGENNALKNLYDLSNESSAISQLKTSTAANSHANQFKGTPYLTGASAGAKNYSLDKNAGPSVNSNYKAMEPKQNNQAEKTEKSQSKKDEDPTAAIMQYQKGLPSATNCLTESVGVHGSPALHAAVIPKLNGPQHAAMKKSFNPPTAKISSPRITEKSSLTSASSVQQITSSAAKLFSNNPPSLNTLKKNINSQPPVQSLQNQAPVNMGIVYPNKNVTATKSAGEHLKRSSEMQIIPTTNPPGSGIISKQFSNISPSISLTALSNINMTANKTASVFGKTKEPALSSVALSNKNNASSNKSLSNINTTGTTERASILNNVNNTPLYPPPTKKVIARPKQATQPAEYTTASAVAKTAAATAVAAKTPNVTSQGKYQSSSPHIGNYKSQLTPPVNQIKRNQAMLKKPNVIGSSDKGTPVLASNQKVEHLAKRTFVKPFSSLDMRPSSIGGAGNTLKMAGAEKPSPADSKMMHAATTGGAGARNFLNIRPVDNKKGPSGTGVYIIEANINQKKIAVGAPTKSGGGTTITKVPLQKKRKAPEQLNANNGPTDAKRPK